MKKIINLGLVLFFGMLAIPHVSAQAVVTLTPGGFHNATLQGTVEQRYSVTVPAGRLIAFTESNIDTVMRIYNAQGTEIAFDDDSGDALNARISIQVVAGAYTIGVTGWSSDAIGPYTIRVSTENVVITPVTPGRPHNATLRGTDEQVFSITVPAGRLIAYTQSNLDTIMRVYDAQGTQIAWDDDSGDSLNARIAVPVSAGTYTIEVRGYSSYDTGPYSLHTLSEQIVITPITPGRPHRATLQGTTEQLYSITVDWAMLTIYTDSELDTVISILSERGDEIAWDDDSGDGLNAKIEHPVPAGTYTIVVHGWGSDDVGPYTLHVLVR